MKSFGAISFTFFLSLFSFSVSAQEVKTTETLIVKTNIWCDHCQQCESCGGRLNREVPFIKGIKDFSFDEKAMTITLTYSTKKTNPEKIRQAISLIGFDADDIKADPKALAKFDDCCKKS